MIVLFRFYAGLNDFLPPERRAARFEADIARRSSVKDAIESLGVPHPEIDLILVNGMAAGFERLLEERDFVSVYPLIRSLRPSDDVRLRPEVPRPVRFVTDVHLGRLTSLLRIAGFDTTSGSDDEKLAAEAARDSRVLLTRDVGLLKRAIVIHGYWIRHTAPWLQLPEVLQRFDSMYALLPFTRCARCNGMLDQVTKEAVAGRLPPRTGEVYDEFWQCRECATVYWRGSHYDRLQRRLGTLGERTE